jgi:hypothetical protein
MLPNRRFGYIVPLQHAGVSFDVTFNRDPATLRFVECFYTQTGAVKFGSDIQALLTDACIAISKLVEQGVPFAAIAQAFGEDRLPGAESGPPSSVLGAIARKGAELEEEVL